MPPRSDEPRRDPPGTRRGSARGGATEAGEVGLGGISEARAYTPRGRTVRESAEQRRTPRSSRSGDPFRPALQVLDGGREVPVRTTRRSTPAAGAKTVRTVVPRGDGAEEPPTRRRTTPSTARRGGRPPTRRPLRKKPRPPKLADPRLRLRLGTLLVLALFATIGIRLVVLQVVDAPAYAGGGLEDRLRVVYLPAARGAIYDRTGAPLAHSVEARYVYADPTLVANRGETAKILSPLLGVARSELEKRMAPRKRDGITSRFEYLARGVRIEKAKQIEELDLKGIFTDRDERREVPGGDLAANLIGFTSQDMAGLEGLEARYDELLRGETGKRVFEVGKGDLNAPIPGGYSRTTEAQPGSSLELTTDRDLQFQAQRYLKRQMDKVQGSTGAAIVIEIRTGEVLAQASHPTYNAANPFPSDPKDREDAATSFVVDPGSVHKAITFGAALQEGVVKPDTAFPVANTIVKGDTPFSDTHRVNGQTLSLPEMMAYSSNVGTIRIADALGKDRLYDYQQRFGLGKPTGVGMPGEAAGRLLPPAEWSGSSHGSVPIGHSVDATPLQMAAVYATIANNGTYVQPRLVRATIGPDGKRTPAPPPVTRPVLSPENAAALRHILEAVTTVPGATGLRARVPGYRVAGKTGTGWRLVNGKKALGEVASFIGMAPAENPRYVVAVFAHTPGGGGGDISAPVFQDLMGYTLQHEKVPPSTGTKAPKFSVHPR